MDNSSNCKIRNQGWTFPFIIIIIGIALFSASLREIIFIDLDHA